MNFLSAIEAAQHRAARNGCGNKGQAAGPVAADAQMQCTDFCGNKPGAKPAKLCGMTEVLHDTGEWVCWVVPCPLGAGQGKGRGRRCGRTERVVEVGCCLYLLQGRTLL